MADKPSFLERLHGRRFGDIELPNDTGEVDPRIKARGTVGDRFKKAAEGFKQLTKTTKELKRPTSGRRR